MKQRTNTIIKSFLIALALTAAPLIALARDSLEALRTDLNAEKTVREAADNTLDSRVNSESTARSTADGNLQTQINEVSPPVQVGDQYQGGIVVYTYDNGRHGLIVAMHDSHESTTYLVPWLPTDVDYISTQSGWAQGIGGGKMATSIIVSSIIAKAFTEGLFTYGPQQFAALLASKYSAGEDGSESCSLQACYADWYLPSRWELDQVRFRLNYIPNLVNGKYWTSNEWDYQAATAYNLVTPDSAVRTDKKSNGRVRAVRMF